MSSPLEDCFLDRWLNRYPHLRPEREVAIPPWVDFHKLHKRRGRPMRADFAWPAVKVAVELQGGTWSGRRQGHSTGAGIERDCRKACLAAAGGWALFPITTPMLRDQEALWLTHLAQTILSRLPCLQQPQTSSAPTTTSASMR
jgi:hypothetical protein